MKEIKEEEIIKALIQADDMAISEEVDCYDVLNYIKELMSKNKELVAHNAISTLLDATRKLLEQGSSKGGVWIKTGDLKDTYSILIQKESLGMPIAALNAKIDDLSVELGQAKATLETEKANLERTIEEMNEVLKANGITIDCDGNVDDSRVEDAKKQVVREFAERIETLCKEHEDRYSHLCKSKKECNDETCRYQGVLRLHNEIKELVKEVCEE